MISLPSWPPACSDTDQEQQLLTSAIDWAMGNALVLRPPAPQGSSTPPTTSVIHGPFALYPTPFPRALFEQAIRLQEPYGALYAHISCDEAFLRKVIGQAVARVDNFQGRLWSLWEEVTKEGISQDLTLGIFRSDYMLHEANEGGELTIQQVEFNTISSSFAALSQKTGNLHRYLSRTGAYPSEASLTEEALPANAALEGLVDGLAAAHEAYGQPSAVIAMIVQEPERNAFDQRAVEWDLAARHSIRVIRLTHLQVLERARLSSTNALEVTFAGQTHDISVIYFRAGYSPNDYPSPREWQARTLLERSKAIKCPSVALQLAGAKKVQQVLSEEGVLESFGGRGRTLDSGALAAIRDSFTTLYPLDDSPLGREAYTLARQTPERFVLKPQREGGGNNVYRDDIPPFLDQLEEQDRQRPAGEPKAREGYILMDLIRTPSLENAMAPAGQGRIVRGSIISELGIYSTVLYRHRSGIEGAEVLSNKQVGHLLRTKASNVSEGGVATGYSVLDSPLLV